MMTGASPFGSSFAMEPLIDRFARVQSAGRERAGTLKVCQDLPRRANALLRCGKTGSPSSAGTAVLYLGRGERARPHRLDRALPRPVGEAGAGVRGRPHARGIVSRRALDAGRGTPR